MVLSFFFEGQNDLGEKDIESWKDSKRPCGSLGKLSTELWSLINEIPTRRWSFGLFHTFHILHVDKLYPLS